MAAEIEAALEEPAQLIQSSGGVFEVEFGPELIFSKKALGRFPEKDEVLSILKSLKQGIPLAQAQQEAGSTARQRPTFTEWLKDFLKRT